MLDSHHFNIIKYITNATHSNNATYNTKTIHRTKCNQFKSTNVQKLFESDGIYNRQRHYAANTKLIRIVVKHISKLAGGGGAVALGTLKHQVWAEHSCPLHVPMPQLVSRHH